ncbi:MAG: phosphonate ABC transporter, permease protein PhnE [Methanosarcinaceae archaeon]
MPVQNKYAILKSVKYKRYIVPVLFTVFFIWSIISTGISISDLINGYPNLVDFIRCMFPPAWDVFIPLMQPAFETLQMAFLGTVFAVILSVPVALFAASNISPSKPMRVFARSIIATTRTIPDIAFALIFVSAVGLGPFPGILALSIHSVGMLGKLYAEAIEEIDPGPVEAVEAVGASKLQAIYYAVIPQAMPSFVATTLYRFDTNVRSSIVLGLVGAGGIGFELIMAMRLFRYHEMSTILIIIFIVVMLAEWASNYIRKQMIGEEVLK